MKFFALAAIVATTQAGLLKDLKHDIEETLVNVVSDVVDEYKQKLATEVVEPENQSCTHGDKQSCDNASACSWCVSFAVPSACHTLADAKSLPSSIFLCDKLNALDEFLADTKEI